MSLTDTKRVRKTVEFRAVVGLLLYELVVIEGSTCDVMQLTRDAAHDLQAQIGAVLNEAVSRS